MSSGINWTSAENAIHAWVVAGSGLAKNCVIWAKQSVQNNVTTQGSLRPQSTFVSMNVTGVQRFGQDWVDVRNNPSPTEGAEVLRIGRGQRRVLLTLQAFDMAPFTPGGAAAILDNVMGAMPLYRSLLQAGGVAVAGFGTITTLGQTTNFAVFEPRAILEVRLNLAFELVTTDTYIEHVQITPTVDGDEKPEFDV